MALAMLFMPLHQLFSQPVGTNYIRQSDFGDSQGTNDPTASQQWIWLSDWNNVQQVGTQSNWFGPNYAPLGTSSHPHYVMLDDAPSNYGALAGRMRDLEYRLVECDFDYVLYNERSPDFSTTEGKLYVILATSENDISAFDPANPQAFETSGIGQVLFTFPFGSSFSGDPQSWTTASSMLGTSQRRKYVLNNSPLGNPGNPYSTVGLVWESEFSETRILLDNFRLVDICPDCPLAEPLRLSGCMETEWATPIRNNYFAYTVQIRDSLSGQMIFQEVNQPSTFRWDGIGNQGTYNGQPAPYDQTFLAKVTYYSCLRSSANVRVENFRLKRSIGCVDSVFGGSKWVPLPDARIRAFPNPVQPSNWLSLQFPVADCPTVMLSDIHGKPVWHADFQGWVGDLRMQIPAHLQKGLYFISISSPTGTIFAKIRIQ
jgi:hypothetical protein